jgi:hypothetical protein
LATSRGVSFIDVNRWPASNCAGVGGAFGLVGSGGWWSMLKAMASPDSPTGA